uniref:SoHo domain-containing protein n=1 Tax=Caenorhabditis tropicalis TaxID=1561998 RepID=A0A1I7UA00_9PELO
MMHHPSSQFGSNLTVTAEPDPESFDQPNRFSPKGNVAALRNVIHGQLDMKTPTGKAPSNSSRYQKPAPPPVDPTPSWAKNVKVYEPNGYVDPHLNKHNMGRVLDGPVNPNKFFQGVPPPSYSLVKQDAKPPVPPSSKPPIQTPAQALQAQVLQNEKPPSDPFRPANQKTTYRIPYDMAMDPRHHFGEFDIDDSASIISSSCTFGDSSEIAAFSAAAEQRHLYEQYRKKLMEEKNELKEGSETPCVSISEKAPAEEPTVSRSLFDTELTPFGHTAKVEEKTTPEEVKPNPFNYSPTEKPRSIDLESSQLLVKPKSPAPYSTSSSDHYGTIRRKHKPVAIDLSESSKSSPKDNKSPMFFGSSFEEKNKSPRTPIAKNDSLNESLNQAFEIASSIETAKNNYEAPPTPKSLASDRSISDTYPVSSPLPLSSTQQHNWETTKNTEPPGSMTNSTVMSTSGANESNASPDSSPDRNEDMSQWYRKMFKQMHKKGDEENERFGELVCG